MTAAKARGIPFSAPMVRALLETPPRKSQTRRLVKPSNSTVLGDRVRASSPAWTGLRFDEAKVRTKSTLGLAVFGPDDAPFDLHLDVPWNHPEDTARGMESGCVYRVRPDYEPGDLLYVRERLQRYGSGPGTVQYTATLTPVDGRGTGVPIDLRGRAEWQWQKKSLPSIHMPRWAARIWLEIVEVRCQRVGEISEEDAKAEGVHVAQRAPDPDGTSLCQHCGQHRSEHVGAARACFGGTGTVYSRLTYRGGFTYLWESIHGPGSWERDKGKWCWALTFKPADPEQAAALRERLKEGKKDG